MPSIPQEGMNKNDTHALKYAIFNIKLAKTTNNKLERAKDTPRLTQEFCPRRSLKTVARIYFTIMVSINLHDCSIDLRQYRDTNTHIVALYVNLRSNMIIYHSKCHSIYI